MRTVLTPIQLITFALATNAIALADSPPPPTAKPAAPATEKHAPVLEKGMTEQQIIAAIGRPNEVKPMKAPGPGIEKAETWVYRRSAGTRQVQVATGTRSVPAFNGMGVGNDATGSAQEIVYSTKFIKIYSVTSLLMIDGKLQLARQTTETEERF